MNSSSKTKKGDRFKELVRRAGSLPVSMLAASEPQARIEQKAETRPQPMKSSHGDPIARRAAELMVGALPPGRSAKDADRIDRVATQLHELKVLVEQQASQRQRGHG